MFSTMAGHAFTGEQKKISSALTQAARWPQRQGAIELPAPPAFPAEIEWDPVVAVGANN
jgi:hypothetical protein